MNNWSRAAIVSWAVLAFLALGYELWCVFGQDAQTPPLTRVVVRYVPWWVTLPFLFWTLCHFVWRYASAGGWASRGITEFLR